MNYVTVTIRRYQETAVIIATPTGKERITRAIVEEAAKHTLEPMDWETLGQLEIFPALPIRADIAEEFHYFEPFKVPTFASRAKEIGVSEFTLRKGRPAGVQVFSDASVKAHVGRQKNYNPRIASRFQPRLSE